ncbi:MAG: hypothetical protein HY913_23760 [Desulfomonile tiedjei]|nr:hypothetical protein [Desulfomonile tiedjei]
MAPSQCKPTKTRVPLEIPLDGLVYRIEQARDIDLPPEAPRLVVVSHVRNSTAKELLRVCLAAIRRFTPEPYELWVVDNNSPMENLDGLLLLDGVNVALNRTEPLPPEGRHLEGSEAASASQLNWGSYANAVGLELAARLINPRSRYFMSLHMDALPCRAGWLSFLQSRLSNGIAAAGVRMDTTRTPEGVLHVLGYMVDFQLFQRLNLSFFPELPRLDVGDDVTIKLRDAGYRVFACPNTFWEPELISEIPQSSPLRELPVDRSFDDGGNVIFLHLGRGLRRSSGEHRKGITAEAWIDFVDNYLLS